MFGDFPALGLHAVLMDVSFSHAHDSKQPIYRIPTINLSVVVTHSGANDGRYRQSFSSRSTGSRDLLQWAVGLQQQRRRVFVMKDMMCVSTRQHGISHETTRQS